MADGVRDDGLTLKGELGGDSVFHSIPFHSMLGSFMFELNKPLLSATELNIDLEKASVLQDQN